MWILIAMLIHTLAYVKLISSANIPTTGVDGNK
jgi:hypothetical protein